jgi:hypothetical protein
VKVAVKDTLGISIGNPSDMLKGNNFKTFSSDNARDFLAGLIRDEKLRDPFRRIHLGLCAITRILNSQREKIDTIKYRELCTDIQLKIVTHFPWAKISPSIHRVLAHSPELIELNEGLGLGSKSEEGLEALNKNIRHLRVHGARKTSISDNFQDVFIHMWRRSSPVVVELDRKKRERRRTTANSTSVIDNLVESIVMPNE